MGRTGFGGLVRTLDAEVMAIHYTPNRGLHQCLPPISIAKTVVNDTFTLQISACCYLLKHRGLCFSGQDVNILYYLFFV